MKPLLRIGVELATVRHVAAGDPIEALPGQPAPLAPQQHRCPAPRDGGQPAKE